MAVVTGDATILVVDDDADFQELMRATLGVQGYRVVAAESGSLALERLRESHVDTVIVDLDRPVTGSIETIEAIRAHPKTRSTPVLVVTGVSEGDERVVNALEAGANDFLCKPYSPPELLRRVEVMVDLHRLHRERSRAVREMAGAASHGLSQPLTSLIGHLELIMERADTLPPELAKSARAAHESALHLGDVVRQLKKVEEHQTVEYVGEERIVDIDGEPESLADRGANGG